MLFHILHCYYPNILPLSGTKQLQRKAHEYVTDTVVMAGSNRRQ